ncbi:MAG: type II toxin-antitoxin system death-on-curing family toxin [Gammaproteobacteria bacterium]|nr:type II toxin-antitoxin system death-on-curing family toxin [Gammaproteobacteria bacterium]
MNEPRWLTLQEVKIIHDKSIQQAGGSHGVRDTGLLESALDRPRNLHAYGEKNVFQLAASYAESFSANQPFVDGNKRTSFASADLFLYLNGHDLQPEQDNNHSDMMVNLAQGKITREEAGQYLKEHSRSLEQSKNQHQLNKKTTAIKEKLKQQRDHARGRKRGRSDNSE